MAAVLNAQAMGPWPNLTNLAAQNKKNNHDYDYDDSIVGELETKDRMVNFQISNHSQTFVRDPC